MTALTAEEIVLFKEMHFMEQMCQHEFAQIRTRSVHPPQPRVANELYEDAPLNISVGSTLLLVEDALLCYTGMGQCSEQNIAVFYDTALPMSLNCWTTDDHWIFAVKLDEGRYHPAKLRPLCAMFSSFIADIEMFKEILLNSNRQSTIQRNIKLFRPLVPPQVLLDFISAEHNNEIFVKAVFRFRDYVLNNPAASMQTMAFGDMIDIFERYRVMEMPAGNFAPTILKLIEESRTEMAKFNARYERMFLLLFTVQSMNRIGETLSSLSIKYPMHISPVDAKSIRSIMVELDECVVMDLLKPM